MAMYEFTTEELVELLGHYTTVTLNNSKKTALEGYLYTIDPNSRNVVLYTDQETVQVIMNHSIQHITIDKERKFDIELIDMKLQYQQNNCKYASKDMLDKRRRDLIQHLETNRIPIEYDKNEPVIHVLGSARVESPYVATSVVCDNVLIRKRVRDLILELP